MATGDGAPSPRSVVDHLMAISPVVQHWGIELVDAGQGTVRMEMDVRPDMGNTHGVCHGGVIFTLGDACFGFSANSYNDRTIAASCEIKFLAPGEVGDRLTAVSTEVWRKGRSGLYDVTITNRQGDKVAILRGHARMTGGKVIDEN